MALANYWRELSPFTRRLLVFAVLNAIVLDLALMVAFQTPWRLTILGEVADFFAAAQGEDSWGPMIRALDYVDSERERAVYDEIFFQQHRKFQYPPTSLLPLWALSPVAAVPGISLLGLLNVVSWLAMVATVYFTVKLFLLAVERSGLDGAAAPSRAERMTRVALVVFVALTFYPLVKAYTQGQIQAWINALFAAAMWLWATSRPRLSGVCLGAVCLIKPQYALFALWGVLRRQWGLCGAIAVTVVAGTGVSFGLIGLADHLNYLDVVRFIGERGESYYSNHSANGLLNRLLFNGNNLAWKGRLFPPFHPWVYALTALSSLVFVLAGLGWRSSARERGGIIDFCVIGLTATLASPVAWEHHYGILMPMFAYVVPRLWTELSFGRRTLVWLGLSFVLCSNFFAVSTALAPIPVANIGQSYLWFGAVMLWLGLVALRSRDRAGRSYVSRVPHSSARARTNPQVTSRAPTVR